MRFSLWVWPPVLLVMLTMSAFPEKTPNRVALVIGNANYANSSMPVPTTIGDAKTLAEEPIRLDFNVSLKTNVGSREMQRSIDAFVDKLDTGMTALFYFAGFGLQIARQIGPTIGRWAASDRPARVNPPPRLTAGIAIVLPRMVILDPNIAIGRYPTPASPSRGRIGGPGNARRHGRFRICVR